MMYQAWPIVIKSPANPTLIAKSKTFGQRYIAMDLVCVHGQCTSRCKSFLTNVALNVALMLHLGSNFDTILLKAMCHTPFPQLPICSIVAKPLAGSNSLSHNGRPLRRRANVLQPLPNIQCVWHVIPPTMKVQKPLQIMPDFCSPSIFMLDPCNQEPQAPRGMFERPCQVQQPVASHCVLW